MSISNHLGIEPEKGKRQEDMAYGVAFAYNFLEKETSSVLDPFNLSLGKFNILMVVKHKGKDKGISQEDIGKSLVVTASNMSRLLDKLEEEELVKRDSLIGNRRIKLIFITKKGSELLEKAWPPYRKKLEELGDLLPEPEQQVMSGLLSKWVDSLAQR